MNANIIKDEKTKPNYVILNEEELIRQVEIRPELYGRSMKAGVRHFLWNEVSEAIGAPVEDCKKRWETLRSTYLRHHKGLTKRKKKWFFYDQLSFLGKQLQIEREQSAPSSSDDNEYVGIQEELENCERTNIKSKNFQNLTSNEDEGVLVDEFYGAQEETYDGIDNFLNIKKKNVNNAESSCSPIYTKVGNNALEETDSADITANENHKSKSDSDEQFLLSCVPILRRLSARKNALARLKIQQILYDVEFGYGKFEIK